MRATKFEQRMLKETDMERFEQEQRFRFASRSRTDIMRMEMKQSSLKTRRGSSLKDLGDFKYQNRRLSKLLVSNHSFSVIRKHQSHAKTVYEEHEKEDKQLAEKRMQESRMKLLDKLQKWKHQNQKLKKQKESQSVDN